MARYQVILEYDGTDFLGFQRQSEVRTVQGMLEEALRQVGWKGKSILAAGRTDTGVHAEGQTIAFDIDWAHTSSDLQKAINANLPADVAARKVREVRSNFHPRYSAIYRQYRYQVICDETRRPMKERFAWRVWPEIQIEPMQAAAARLPGTHDFAAFGSPPRPGGSTIRTIQEAVWSRKGNLFVFNISGDAFLYHMVRRMAALMVEIGQGRKKPDVLSGYLSGEMGEPVQGLAPAHGLILSQVIYPADYMIEDSL
jgi:tRNA pseudouridine38-40 synthase